MSTISQSHRYRQCAKTCLGSVSDRSRPSSTSGRIRRWRLDSMGVVPAQVAGRGVADPAVLPYYPYRDDATALYAAIERYVRSVVEDVYSAPGRLAGDWELQHWRRELTQPRDQGGVGLLGVPGDEQNGTERAPGGSEGLGNVVGGAGG